MTASAPATGKGRHVTTASFKPTDEQTEILDRFRTGESVIVEALAGTGKTSSLKMLAGSEPGKRGLYLAFNKAVAEEAKGRFPSSVECRTVHSMAFAAAGRPYEHRLGKKPALTPAAAAKHLGQTAAFGTGPSALRPNKLLWLANLTVAKFIKDLTEDVEIQHVDIPDTIRVKVLPKDMPQLRQLVLELARKVWQDTLDPQGTASRFTHDSYIKIWQLSNPRLDYDYILVDECQPTGTEVWSVDFGRKHFARRIFKTKIEDLQAGDRVVSYNPSGNLRATGAIVKGISSRLFDGDLITVETDNGLRSRYTPNHRCMALIGPGFENKHVLYLMRKGQSFRIGVMGPRLTNRSRTEGVGLSTVNLAIRLNEERADAIWVLQAFDDRREATLAEDAAAAIYGLPQTIFREQRASSISQERLDLFWSQFGDMADKAQRCLAAFGRDIAYPLTSKGRERIFTHKRLTEIRACNLLDGMLVLDANEMMNTPRFGHKNPDAWRPIAVGREPYIGDVWSMTVEPDHTYVGDGIVTHNCQDTDPVAAGIYAAQDEHTQLVLVGDAAQSIYAFRGAISFLSDFDAKHRVPLTQSFRFGADIAEEANVWLDVIGSELRVRGNPARDSWIDRIGRPHAVLCRSNAGAFQGFLESMNRGHAVALGGKGDEMKRFAEGAKTLQERHYSTHPDLVLFSSWAEARAYAETDPHGSEIAMAVKLVDKFGTDAIITGVDRATPENRAQVVYGTAHSAKGREWETVRIHNDFHPPADDKAGRARPVERQEAMLAYVTVTRAKEGLDTGGLAYIHSHMRRLRTKALSQAS